MDVCHLLYTSVPFAYCFSLCELCVGFSLVGLPLGAEPVSFFVVCVSSFPFVVICGSRFPLRPARLHY